MKKIFSLALLVMLLVGCKVDPEKNIYKAKVGDEYLCLEKEYMAHGDDPNTDTILLSMIRPDMAPIRRNSFKDMGAESYWKNKTGLLLNKKWDSKEYNSPNVRKSIESRVRDYTPLQEKKYALTMTKNNTKSQHWTYYIEPTSNIEDRDLAYIRCSKYYGVENENPQCTHTFDHGELHYLVDYSIRNLSNWKKIKQQMIDFVENKKCNSR